MKPLILSVCLLLINSPLGRGERIVFQNGLDDYTGTVDTTLSGNPEKNATENLGGRETLEVSGIPKQGKKQMSLIRFDNLFGSQKNQIPPGSNIRSAWIGFYKIGQEGSPKTYASASPSQLFVTVHRMLTPFYAAEPDSPSDVYSCYSFRAYGTGDDQFWGGRNQIEPGPVALIDYETKPLGRIPLEMDVLDTWYWVDVTADVQAWSEGEANHGLFLLAHGWWLGATFASGQYEPEGCRPQLVVEWD